MTTKILEEKMEEQIEEYLKNFNGFITRQPIKYNKDLCFDQEIILQFIYATQPNSWETLKEQHGDKVKEKFFKRLFEEIQNKGTLTVLRKGINDYGVSFDLFYPRPSSNLNLEYGEKYQANFFSVMRQVRFSTSNNKSLDMVIFVNGLPIITLELKDQLTGSGYTVKDAIKQYKVDRDPKEPLFRFKRCLVHFAVDEDLVFMTTQLEGGKTKFLPFNRGRDGGAGNPDTSGFRTEYLWKEIFTREILSDILQDFLVFEDILDDKGKKIGERLIFPRYHQLDAVRKLINSSKASGPGRNYLIQHSAGSGKSNTIAWLSHKLASLHDSDDNVIFDSIIVVTDRRVLDEQLQRTIRQFQKVNGVVMPIDKRSKQLKEALESGKKIIVTTIQKFPYIVDDIQNPTGRNFAVVVDEAHSSQSGETSKQMKKVLRYASLEEAEREDKGEPTWEDELNDELESRGHLSNVSFYAFTATPKSKTFELFGDKLEDGRFKAFHIYSMRQAIEEGFILDVLQNYTTCKTFFQLLKTIENDPEYDKKRTTAILRYFVDLHPHSINKKIKIIAEHFHDHIIQKIPDDNGDGQAKAMIVTRSRLHAVRYKLACDKYLKERKYDNIKALVAFSGTVEDPDDGIEHTESSMNHFPESQTVEEFKNLQNKILIVAEKFQTGFDQPLLYAMYVDKVLSNIAAVQTLSRLNRINPNKDNPIVMDFANEADAISDAFEPYYGTTMLSEGTDPNRMYDLQHGLSEFYIYTQEDVNEFAEKFFNPKINQDKLHPILNKVVENYNEIKDEEAKEDFKKLLKTYIRLYAFLSQIITFQDVELEKLYVFGRMLLRKLPKRNVDPIDIADKVDMDALRIERINQGTITLEEGDDIGPSGNGQKGYKIRKEEPLSIIIQDLNDKFSTDFTDADKIIVLSLQERIKSNNGLVTSAKVNSKDKVRLTFDQVFNDELQNIVDEHFDFYKKVNDNEDIKKALVTRMFEVVYKKLADVK